MKTRLYKKITFTLMLLTILIAMSACSEKKTDDDKAIYKAELTEYYNQISLTSVSINNIDVNQPGGPALLLNYLDTMQTSFNGLANMNVPARYEPLKTITAEASASFNQANVIYHEIYAGDTLENFDADKAIVAGTYYQEAMNKLVQLGKSFMADEESSSESTSNQASDTAATTGDTVSSN